MNVVLRNLLIEDKDFLDSLRRCLGEKANLYTLRLRRNEWGKAMAKMLLVLPLIAKSLLGERLIHIYEYGSLLLKYRLPLQVNIYLNHGWGTKRTPGILEAGSKKGVNAWRCVRANTDYVICYSKFDSTYFLRHELLDDLPMPKFLPLGHPRNDFLVKLKDDQEYKKVKRKSLGIPMNSRVILFAPTHRETLLTNGIYDEKLLKLHLFQLEKIDRICADLNTYILYRPHYFTSNIEFPSGLRNIIIVTAKKEPDPRPLMLVSDMLITDYSSIFVDYLLLQKPIVFYQPDLELYQNRLRGLAIDPSNPIHFPGPRIDKLSDIFDLSDSDFKKYDLQASRDFFHEHHDDKATERLVNFIKKLGEDRPSSEELNK